MLRILGFPFNQIRKVHALRESVLRGFVCTISYLVAGSMLYSTFLIADDAKSTTSANKEEQSLEQLKRDGKARSRFLQASRTEQDATAAKPDPKPPEPNLADFRTQVEPILRSACLDCHGPDSQEGNLRIDSLDPNLHVGKDVDWWMEIFSVVSKGEMPPADSKSLTDGEQKQIVDWLSSELHTASMVRRQSTSQTVFRRMTRYEYNYALQDLLGLPWDFAKDLPPEAKSTEGFRNTAEHLGMSVSQIETFQRLSRQALYRATVQGSKPAALAWSITMKDVSRLEWPKQDQQIVKAKTDFKDDEKKLQAELEKLEQSFSQPRKQTYFRNLQTGRTVAANWEYDQAKYAIAPVEALTQPPTNVDQVAIIPAGKWLNVELGNKLPDDGTLRIRVRACRSDAKDNRIPSLQLHFGWQASNEGRALLPVSQRDQQITAEPDAAELYQWDIPLGEIYPRNSVRKTSAMGTMPSPSEYIRIVNSSASQGDVQIDYVEVQAPVYDQWPPASHQRIFFPSSNAQDETKYAREIIASFMHKAWRRTIAEAELELKLKLFGRLRPDCGSFEEAVIETLASVLSSPHFLYLVQSQEAEGKTEATIAATVQAQSTASNQQPVSRRQLSASELATRLSMFLWCSIPDEELLTLAENGSLVEPKVLEQQVQRMLNDARSQRMAKQFVHQWLDLELLDFLNFQQHVPNFDPLLKEAMLHEPVALFEETLRSNESVLNFLHSDYMMANERLARHYGIKEVRGNDFQRVSLDGNPRRGGLLTQAGMLAMNSDYPDSHPLKRGKWILVSLLNDPPPPPPPAVPQIDLTNPEIAKMTLKERIEDHRNQPACKACHMKIDPWGIAFENYDALGKWRDKIGEKPVDAASELSNHIELDGMMGLKRYLLEHRQDQFVGAMVHKMTTFALGRSLKFADRADLDEITKSVRLGDDGLRTMVAAIVTSELFRTR